MMDMSSEAETGCEADARPHPVRPAAEQRDGNVVIGTLLGSLIAALIWGGLVVGLQLLAG